MIIKCQHSSQIMRCSWSRATVVILSIIATLSHSFCVSTLVLDLISSFVTSMWSKAGKQRWSGFPRANLQKRSHWHSPDPCHAPTMHWTIQTSLKACVLTCKIVALPSGIHDALSQTLKNVCLKNAPMLYNYLQTLHQTHCISCKYAV